MKLKSKFLNQIKLILKRSFGEYKDGFYVENEEEKFQIIGCLQPYKKENLEKNRDFKVEKTSLLLFSDFEIRTRDSFEYHNKLFVIETVDPNLGVNYSYYEGVCHASLP